MSRLGDAIREARMAKGMTAKAVARKAGVSESFIMEAESGRRIINDDTANRILKILGAADRPIAEYDGGASADEPVQAAPQRKPAAPRVQTQPKKETGKVSEVWEAAFGGVLRRVPVTDISGAETGYRMLAVEGGKIEGLNSDRAFYVIAPDDELYAFRIHKGDRVLCEPAARLYPDSFMLVEYGGERMLRHIRLQNGRCLLDTFFNTMHSSSVPEKEVKPIGICRRVEVDLGAK